MKTSKKISTRVLVESAMLVALSCVLSLYPKIEFLPYGGSITFCAVPIILISYRRGLKWGLFSGFVLSLFQMMTGFVSAGLTGGAIVVVVLFDYLVAFTVLGFGGIFRGKFKHRSSELVLGSVFAIVLRYISHVISGFWVWGDYAEWFFGEAGAFGEKVLTSMSGSTLSFFYSIVYNATYLVPEMILAVIVTALLSKYALINVD